MSPWCHCPPYHHENPDTTLHSRPFDPLPPPPPPLRTIRPGPVVQQQHINNDHSHNQFRDPYSHRRPSKPNPVHHPTSQNHHHHHSQYPKLWILSSSLERRTMGVLMALTFLISIVINVDYRLNHYLQTISQSILFNNSCSTTKTTRSSSSSRGNIRKHPSIENDERKSSVSPLHDKTLSWDNDQFPHAWLAYEQQQQQHEPEPHFKDVDVTTRNSTTMMIPKPPYMILWTEYGWNHPNPKRGLTFARSIRSTEYIQSIVNHPYFHPTAYHEIMIAQTRSVDPNMTYYVFLDIETCYETNYPHYRKSYRGNCDRTGSRMYYSYTYIKHRRPPTAACYNLDDPQCHYIPTEIYTNPIFTHPNTITKNNTNKLVVLDCRGNGPNVLFRKKSPGNSTALALVSLSSTAQQLNGQIDQGLPPPSIQTIPYRTTTTTTTTTSTSSMSQYDQEISCDCHSFLEPTTNDTTTTHDENAMPPLNRKYLLSFSGDYRRHAVRHELAKLDTVQSSTSLRDPAATPIIAEQKRPLVLITDSKELYHSTNGLSYSELLLSSQYVAVPRGDNLFSYRFSEVLSSGAIPVLIHNTEWILPFRPEIVQWDRCVIRITAQEINTTVTILQNISSYEQCQRRQYCYYVYETYMKNSSASIQGILDGLQAIAV